MNDNRGASTNCRDTLCTTVSDTYRSAFQYYHFVVVTSTNATVSAHVISNDLDHYLVQSQHDDLKAEDRTD